jgi:hypothetical protein
MDTLATALPPSLNGIRDRIERIGRSMPNTEQTEAEQIMDRFGGMSNFGKMFDNSRR